MQIILHEKFERASPLDEHIFKDMYRKYFVKLFRFAVSLTHCNEAAEEIVHDVLINLWNKRKISNEIENFDSYLYISVKNLSLNYLRDNGKHIHVELETLYNADTYVSIDPESIVIGKERLKNINAIINHLPSKCLMVFRLIKEDGLKYKDAATLLNISVKTVENQLAIALKKIAAALK